MRIVAGGWLDDRDQTGKGGVQITNFQVMYLQWKSRQWRVPDPLRDDREGDGDAGDEVPGEAVGVVLGGEPQERELLEPEVAAAEAAERVGGEALAPLPTEAEPAAKRHYFNCHNINLFKMGVHLPFSLMVVMPTGGCG